MLSGFIERAPLSLLILSEAFVLAASEPLQYKILVGTLVIIIYQLHKVLSHLDYQGSILCQILYYVKGSFDGLGCLEQRFMAEIWGCQLNPWELRRQIISNFFHWTFDLDQLWMLRKLRTLRDGYKPNKQLIKQ